MTTIPDVRWDPYDTVLDDDPYPVWRRLRDEAPVYRNDRYDFWALSRFADVEAASREAATFSSAHGTVLERIGAEPIATAMMIWVDPPDHTRLRGLVSRALTPRRVTALEGRVRSFCADLLDKHRGSTGFDYVRDFGAQVPSRVISALVGVPPGDQEMLREVVDRMFHIEPGIGMVNDTSITAGLTLAGYLAGLVSERAASPRDDMVSDLVHAEIADGDGSTRRLTRDECVSFAVLLYTAGTETVAKLLGNAAVILADHPGQRAAMATDRALVPAAVEELLRFEAPSPVNGRWTTGDVTIHGVTIPAGSAVLLLTGSAGRDEREFADPDRFDIRRSVRQQISFGHGVHFCLGAALARLEARVAIEETLARFPTWDVDAAGLVRAHTSTVRGFASVPVHL